MLRQVVGIGLWLTVFALAPVDAARRHGSTSNDAPPLIYVGRDRVRVPALIDRGRVLVPVRGVFEAIGADVSYAPPHFVIVRKDGAVIAAFILGRSRAVAGRRAVELESPPVRHAGRIYVPLRVVAEAAGAAVAYTSRPAAVHIVRHGGTVIAGVMLSNAPASARERPDTSQRVGTAKWRTGVAIFTGLCCLGCLVLTARRFAPTLFGPVPAKRTALPVQTSPAPLDERPSPPPDSVALKSVESSGEARFHKQLVTETRTIEVPVTREELIIEYAGEGGTVFIQGRPLAPGETVRIPLWEERVHVDVTKHVMLKEDIVVEKRRMTASAPATGRQQPPDPDVAEGNPS